MTQQFLVDQADTIRMTVYENNRPIVPTSANITLYKPGGSVLQAQAAASVDGTTGEMTYSLTSTHTDVADLDYKAVWDYVHNGTTFYQTQLFDVVKSLLAIPITDDDLYNELDSLRQANVQDVSVATSATSSTLLDTAQRKESDDYWKGGKIEILSGTGISQIRDITGFTQSTSTVSVTPDWATTPDTTSRYRIIRSWSHKIQQGFDAFNTMLYNKGKRHQLILESSQITFPLIYLTIHHIAMDLFNEPEDKWDIVKREYKEKFDNFFSNMRLNYDKDDSGTIDDEEQQETPTTFTFYRR